MFSNFFKTDKSQGAIEFMILISGLLFFFVSMLIVVSYNTADKHLEREEIALKSLALSVADEISLAQKSFPGYKREFTIPSRINGKIYFPNMTDSYITITIPNRVSILIPIGRVENLNSTPQEILERSPNKNTIIKNETGVYLNV